MRQGSSQGTVKNRMQNGQPHRGDGKPVRWWPGAVILAVVLGTLAWIWLPETSSLQSKVTASYPTLVLGALFLLLWVVLFSRLPVRIRLTTFLLVSVGVALGILLWEITGVDGNLVPVVAYRWRGERQFDDRSTTAAATTVAGPDDYAQFYGPGRTAKLPGPKLARDWESDPPRQLWRRKVGEGWSSFAIVGDAAVTQEQRGEGQVVVRYSLATGEQVWVSADGPSFVTTVGGRGPRATPTLVDGVVYSLTANGDLGCRDLETGDVVWRRNVLSDHGAGRPDWGTASSPLVVGEVVIVQLGRNGDGLAGYDRRTGDSLWLAGDSRGTYSSPLLAEVLGRPLVLIVNHTEVAGHDPASGEKLLTVAWPNPTGGERVTMPLMLDSDRMMVSAGYGVGSALFRVEAGRGGMVGLPVWESPRLKSKFAPMVERQGVVYGLDEGVLVAIDPETGERLWKRGRYGHGQMILVDDLLLIQAEKGEVVLVEANPGRHVELGRLAALDGKTWNPPALSGNRLVVRNNTEAACYELPLADPHGS